MLLQFCDLLAKSGLGDVQPVRRTGEVHFFRQNDYCREMTHFDIGEHNSNPPELRQVTLRGCD